MNYANSVLSIFAQPRYLKVFLLIMVLFSPLLAITSDILILSTLTINPLVDPVKILIIGAIVFLMSINGTLMFHNYETRAKSGVKTTALGVIGAFFTTACPICQPIWLVWLGLGSVTAFLADISIYVGIFSVVLLLISIVYSFKSASSVCEVKINGKNN
ncbi:hypothetical protein HY990_05865 [Candidatus Micrarchaeota archaeon]|nr:hypothetical protein [Candidatus Micrarchaeota archaeon]